MRLVVILIMLGCFSAHAQNGTKYLSLKGGIGVRGVYEVNASYDYNTKYYNQHEMFGEFMVSNNTGYQTMMGGFVIKPVQLREFNSTLRWRLGAGVGTDFKKFIAAPQLGWEFSQTFRNRLEMVITNKYQAVLWAPKSERWRFMGGIGMRIPLN